MNISKTVRANEICLSVTLIENGTSVNVVHYDLDLHFPGQTFSYYAFDIKYCTGSGCRRQICFDSHGPRLEVALILLPL